MDKKIFYAFSLVEMLMALLVASLLLAALAPVMTKRLNGESINVSGSGESVNLPERYQCWDYNHMDLENDSDGTLLRVLDVPTDTAYTFNFILASGGGGGAGATSSETKTDSYSGNDTGLTITYDMDEFDIDSMTGGGGGAGGGAGKYSLEQFTANKDDCENLLGKDTHLLNNGSMTNKIAVYDSANKLCVTKFNQIQGGSYTSGKCWTSYTHASCNNDGSPAYNYNGCQRAICTHTGAANACNYLNQLNGLESVEATRKWRLPTKDEIEKWNNASIWKTLNLCDKSNNGVVPWCDVSGISIYKYNGVNYDTYPYTLWSNTSSGSNWYYSRLDKTWYAGNSYYASEPAPTSTRCVLSSSKIERFYSLQGGSGSNAPKLSKANFNSSIKETMNKRIRENIGGKIVFEIGEGGKGGESIDKKDIKAKDGKDGERSCILIKSSPTNGNKDIYRICVPGGKGGYGADGTIDNLDKEENIKKAIGKGGDEVLSENNCIAYDYTTTPTTETKFNCTEGSLKGNDGESKTDNPAYLNGLNATISGNGGVGGYANKTDSTTGGEATLTFGKGGNGAKGSITISYKPKYEAAGGGGGGGGYVAHITNVANNAFGKENAHCTIKIGYGGKGGAPGYKGYDGGDTSIICTGSNAEYKVLGGKGGEIGTSAKNAGEEARAGKGGSAGDYYDKVSSLFQSLMHSGSFHGIKAEDGRDGADKTNTNNNNNNNEISNYELNIKSAGGAGGASGTKQQGKCGGLYNEENLCSSPSIPTNDEDLNGGSYEGEHISTPLREEIGGDNPKFGQAGGGGGGGAWYTGFNPGRGGDGQAGYVCIYWNEPES